MGVTRVFDWDDYSDDNHDWTYERLQWLRELNPAFRCTLFTITNRSEQADALPDWIEVVPHGWDHPHPMECHEWTMARTLELIEAVEKRPRFVWGFKAPGWQISDDSLKTFASAGWWVADQEYNRPRRPKGLRVYELGPEDWHGHIPNVCGNGIEETWDKVVELVRATRRFQFASERTVTTWLLPSPS